MTTYFDGAGKEFTDKTAQLAVARAKELDVSEYAISSNMGASAWALIDALEGNGTGITVVTHSAGFREPYQMEMEPSERDRLATTGAKVVTATHVLSGVERGLSKKHQGTYPAMIIAETLRLFGQGMKVAVECAIMAADAGALSGNRIVSIGGTGRGVDTAVVMTPGHATSFLGQLKIHEIICKPNLY